MGRVKGNIQNRIRFWRYQLLKRKQDKLLKEQVLQKKLKQEQVLLEKNGFLYLNPNPKRYHKLQIFFSFIFGYLFSFLEFRKKEITSKQLNVQIEVLVHQIEEEKKIEVLNKYQQELEKKEEMLLDRLNEKRKVVSISRDITSYQSSFILLQKAKQLLEDKVKKQESFSSSHLEVKEDILKQEEGRISSIKIFKTQSIQSELGSKSLLKEETKASRQENKAIRHSSLILENRILPISPVFNQKEGSQKGTETKSIREETKINVMIAAYLKKTNTKLKKYKKQLDQLNQNQQTEEEKRTNDQKRYALLSKLYELEKEYHEISCVREFYELKKQIEYAQLDPALLLQNDQAIWKLIEKCQKELQHKSEVKITVKKKPVQKEKQLKEERLFAFHKDKIEQIKTTILLDLQRQMEGLRIFKIEKSISIKKTFHPIRRMIFQTLQFILPFSFFRRPVLANLASSILLYNHIETIQKALKNQRQQYEMGNVLDSLKKKQDAIIMTRYYLNTSLEKIQVIKQQLLEQMSDYPEMKGSMVLLEQLESTIYERNQELYALNQQTKKRQKILKHVSCE